MVRMGFVAIQRILWINTAVASTPGATATNLFPAKVLAIFKNPEGAGILCLVHACGPSDHSRDSRLTEHCNLEYTSKTLHSPNLDSNGNIADGPHNTFQGICPKLMSVPAESIFVWSSILCRRTWRLTRLVKNGGGAFQATGRRDCKNQSATTNCISHFTSYSINISRLKFISIDISVFAYTHILNGLDINLVVCTLYLLYCIIIELHGKINQSVKFQIEMRTSLLSCR
jgi:hypothetical protein